MAPARLLKNPGDPKISLRNEAEADIYCLSIYLSIYLSISLYMCACMYLSIYEYIHYLYMHYSQNLSSAFRI